MGKWDSFRGKYPKVPLDADYYAKLAAVLDAPAPKEALGPAEADLALSVRCLSDFQVNKMYVAARDRKDKLVDELKSTELEIEALTRMFVERFEDAGESSKTFEDGVSISVTVEPYPFVADQGKLLSWVRQEGLEALLTLNYSTMASLVKERLEGKVNKPLPDGVDVYMKDKLTCRGRKKGQQE